jgi:hypothetical protein
VSERLVMVAKGSVREMRALAERCGEHGVDVALRRCTGRS